MASGSTTVFGGSGFIGRHLVNLLLRRDVKVRVAVRDPGCLQVAAGSAQALETIEADVLSDAAVARAVAGAAAVFNLVGILTETRMQTYRAIHVEGAQRVALAAKREGVGCLIQISALGASRDSPAVSDRTKSEGELAVRALFPEATIVRPSLVFGEDDHFFNTFAGMARRSPVLPLIGGGTTKFQPLSVADMAAGLATILERPGTAGRTYEFGGPRVYSFRELLELLLTTLHWRRLLVPIPFALAEIQGALLARIPNPPLTRDQVRLLKTDKTVGGEEPTLADLGVRPGSLEAFLPVLKDIYG